jgi:hypothetical protein
MRIAAIMSLILGQLLLFLVADLRWGFVRLRLAGLESGLIVASMAWFAGIAASVAATLFAILHLRRTAGVRSSRWLLVWCFVLAIGFAAVFIV